METRHPPRSYPASDCPIAPQMAAINSRSKNPSMVMVMVLLKLDHFQPANVYPIHIKLSPIDSHYVLCRMSTDQVNICMNCDQSFTGLYCNHCGQKIAHRLNTSHVLHELFHSLTHTD